MVTVNARDMMPRRIKVSEFSLQVSGLRNSRTYSFRIDVVDGDGYVWEGLEFAATAGERATPPKDVAAWWTFDEIRDGQVVDALGHGRGLRVVGEGISQTEGVAVNALVFADEGSYLRLDEVNDLAIGSGDYAVSVWIRRAPSTAMADFLISEAALAALGNIGASLRRRSLSASTFHQATTACRRFIMTGRNRLTCGVAACGCWKPGTILS